MVKVILMLKLMMSIKSMFIFKFNVYILYDHNFYCFYFSEKNLVKDSSSEMRQKALTLLNTSSEIELRVVKGMTTKKFDAIVALRPFSSWYDAVSRNYDNLHIFVK